MLAAALGIVRSSGLKIVRSLTNCIATTRVVMQKAPVGGRRCILVEIPGFVHQHESDFEGLNEVAYWLAWTYQAKTKLAGIICLHRITDKVTSAAAQRNIRMFEKLCGDQVLSDVFLVVHVTTSWEYFCRSAY